MFSRGNDVVFKRKMRAGKSRAFFFYGKLFVYMGKLLFILFFVLFGTSFAYAVESPLKNAGFVPSNIWYSKDVFFAGDKVRIYTVIFNGSTQDLTGIVEFLDNGSPIGKTNFSLSSGGRVQDVWIDWIASQGAHVVTARLMNVIADGKNGKQQVLLDNTEAGKSDRIVDLDTDGDGIGNADDPDDDNYGIPDVEELRNGTDPLKKDTNGNGISDGKELEIAAKKKVEAERLLASSTESTGSILGIINKVQDAIPEPVKVSASAGANVLERFRVGEGYQVRLAKEEKAREIDAIKVRMGTVSSDSKVLGTTANVAEKPFAYVSLGLLTALQYFFDWQVLFYGITLYLVYRVIRWGIGRWRDR